MYDTNDTRGISLESASSAGIDESYFEVKAVQLLDNHQAIHAGVDLPIYPCLQFEQKTGRVPFQKVNRTDFQSKLKDAYCVDT